MLSVYILLSLKVLKLLLALYEQQRVKRKVAMLMLKILFLTDMY